MKNHENPENPEKWLGLGEYWFLNELKSVISNCTVNSFSLSILEVETRVIISSFKVNFELNLTSKSHELFHPYVQINNNIHKKSHKVINVLVFKKCEIVKCPM